MAVKALKILSGCGAKRKAETAGLAATYAPMHHHAPHRAASGVAVQASSASYLPTPMLSHPPRRHGPHRSAAYTTAAYPAAPQPPPLLPLYHHPSPAAAAPVHYPQHHIISQPPQPPLTYQPQPAMAPYQHAAQMYQHHAPSPSPSPLPFHVPTSMAPVVQPPAMLPRRMVFQVRQAAGHRGHTNTPPVPSHEQHT